MLPTRVRKPRAKKLTIVDPVPSQAEEVVEKKEEKEEAPVAQEEAPVAQEEAPVAQEEAPVAQEEPGTSKPEVDHSTKVPTNTLVVKRRPEKKRSTSIYSESLLKRDVLVPFKNVGKNLRETLDSIIRFNYEGKCGPEGFVRPGSTKILTHSSGVIKAANVIFTVAFECLVCNPVEGMHVRCVAKNITKAGIRAEVDETVTPVVIFVARDHHYMSTAFNEVQEGDQIVVKVIGQRFELNDTYVSVIAQFLEKKTKYMGMGAKVAR